MEADSSNLHRKGDLGKDALQAEFECQICREIYENPRILSCGHSFCCECILTQLNCVLNTSKKNDCCPVCNDKTSMHDLRPNIALRDLSHIYKLNSGKYSITPLNSDNSNNSSSNNSNRSNSNGGTRTRIEKVFPSFSFQTLAPKDIKTEIAKMISNLTKGRGAALNINKIEDRTQLIHLYHKFKIKHDSQIHSKNAKTLEDVIEEVNKEMKTIDKNKSKGSGNIFDQNNARLTKELEELLKSGKVTTRSKQDL